MPELPVVSGRDARRAFERLGWVFRLQTGSHMLVDVVLVLIHEGPA